MSSPTPIITPPPTKPKRFDWTGATKKLSTLVAAASVSYGLIASAIMAHYLALSPAQQETWPWWVPMALVAGPGIIAGLGPFAVAFRQAFIDDTDSAGI
jgi:hypothetical protein